MAKKKNAVLPKTFAGVKVPKSIRKSRLIGNLLASTRGRKIMADALVAGAGAAATILIAERKEIAEGTKAGLRKAGRRASVASQALEGALSAMAGVVTDAAGFVLPKEQGGKARSKKDSPEEVRPH